MEQIHLSHKGSSKKGLKQRLLHVKAEDTLKEYRKPSPSTSHAKRPPAVEEAGNVVLQSLRS